MFSLKTPMGKMNVHIKSKTLSQKTIIGCESSSLEQIHPYLELALNKMILSLLVMVNLILVLHACNRQKHIMSEPTSNSKFINSITARINLNQQKIAAIQII